MLFQRLHAAKYFNYFGAFVGIREKVDSAIMISYLILLEWYQQTWPRVWEGDYEHNCFLFLPWPRLKFALGLPFDSNKGLKTSGLLIAWIVCTNWPDTKLFCNDFILVIWMIRCVCFGLVSFFQSAWELSDWCKSVFYQTTFSGDSPMRCSHNDIIHPHTRAHDSRRAWSTTCKLPPTPLGQYGCLFSNMGEDRKWAHGACR